MEPLIINGNETAAAIRAEMAKEVEEMKKQGVEPGLGFVLVGDNPASQA